MLLQVKFGVGVGGGRLQQFCVPLEKSWLRTCKYQLCGVLVPQCMQKMTVSTLLKQFYFVSGPFRIQIQATKCSYEFYEGMMWVYSKLSTTKATFISIVKVTIIIIIVLLISPYHHRRHH